jgi:hypothetical protein
MSEKSWVPDGYSVVEMAVPDEMAKDIGQNNSLLWKRVRRREKFVSVNSMTYTATNDMVEGNSLPVIVSNVPDPKYREPTAEDAGKMVEVSDSEQQWFTYELLAVLPEDIYSRFIVRGKTGAQSYSCTYARIKIEEGK